MKTLYYLRHAETDGPDLSAKGLEYIADYRNLGERGLERARLAGKRSKSEAGLIISHLFYGAIARTAQTALAWCKGMGYVPVIHPAVPEIWDDGMYREIDTPKTRALIADGATKLEAIHKTCSRALVDKCSSYAVSGVARMFGEMNLEEIDIRGDVGIAFGHEQIILLAAVRVQAENDSSIGAGGFNPQNKLSELCGVIFRENKGGSLSVAGLYP